MKRRTFRRLWKTAGLAGAIGLCIAWVDSGDHCCTLSSGWSPKLEWPIFKVVSLNSALHLVADHHRTFSLGSFSSSAIAPSFEYDVIDRKGESSGVFPAPFFVRGSPGLSAMDPSLFVGGGALTLLRAAPRHRSTSIVEGRIRPNPAAPADEVCDLCLPYWLLLSGGGALWLGARGFSRRRGATVSAVEADPPCR